jgi:hypothetical protein
MNITLTIQEADYGFVVEAIKLRTTSMLESLDHQFARQKQAAAQPIERKIIEEPWEAEYKGDKIVAKRKVKAPYGVKKDGTPKQRPGRRVAAS